MESTTRSGGSLRSAVGCLRKFCHEAHPKPGFQASIQPFWNPRQYLFGVLRNSHARRYQASSRELCYYFSSSKISMIVAVGIEILNRAEAVSPENLSPEDEPVEAVEVIHDTGPMIHHDHARSTGFEHTT